MSFWIRKYKIELKKLPLALLSKGTLVVFLCVLILGGILLFLPIQDTIKGDVIIYGNGQPLTLQAPTSGFLNLKKSEHDIITKGDLIATIDVDVPEVALTRLKTLIYDDLVGIDFKKNKAIIDQIKSLSQYDFRQINNEMLSLLDLFTQLDILSSATDPKQLLETLDRSIQLKRDQVQSFAQLGSAHQEVIDLLEQQLESDKLLLQAGAISDREYKDRQRVFIDKKSVLIENELLRQEMSGQIINDEKEKFALTQDHRSRVEELRLNIVKQVGNIRSQFQSYLDQYIIIAPISGYATLPYDVVDKETIAQGEDIMYMSLSKDNDEVISEMFVDAQNAGKISQGMNVRIGLSEFNQREFGIYYSTVRSISEVQQDGKYKVTLNCELPIKTSYEISLPSRERYNGRGEVMIGKINLLTKISREIQFNKSKYASL